MQSPTTKPLFNTHSNITELKLSLTLCTELTLELILDLLTKPTLTAPQEQGQK